MKRKRICFVFLLHVLLYPEIIYAHQPGINKMLDLLSLPVLEKNLKINYEGSIDKNGANADWDWFLYEDRQGEWVIFDVKGPGCIYNFVQHRYISSEEPVFKFYFDGENSPRFIIKSSEFGEKYPFIEPLASKYIGPLDNGRGPIRVIRSFVPMVFKNGCKITSTVKLEGHDRSKGQGGWGHVTYHQYSSDVNIKTFSTEDDYSRLVQLWKNIGTDPKSQINNKQVSCSGVNIPASGSATLIDIQSGSGYIAGINIKINEMKPEFLENVWIKATWDNHIMPDVYCPIGCFFGNSIGFNKTNYLLMGSNPNGQLYNYFPMPFWNSATISIENKGFVPVNISFGDIQFNEDSYKKETCGYFRSSKYYERKHTLGKDSRIGIIKGSGKMVAAHVTCYGERPNIITCEGDVRVYIDGLKTPQVESDGSESYICYGWGFPTPPETHPLGGYDGLSDNPWSMTRLCLSDNYPFNEELIFGIESGENNNQYLEHSGCIFYYGKNDPSIELSDELDLKNQNSIRKHNYKAKGNIIKSELTSCFEGDEDDIPITGMVYRFTEESSFYANINPQNSGIKIRRRSDQINIRQCARVYIDDIEVRERLWYFADHNPCKRWLEDEFNIPLSYTEGKNKIKIRIEPISFEKDNTISWNESFYMIFSIL